LEVGGFEKVSVVVAAWESEHIRKHFANIGVNEGRLVIVSVV
jgi:hypothetical protein